MKTRPDMRVLAVLAGLAFFLALVPGGLALWMHGQLAWRDAQIGVLLPELERLRAVEAVFDDERTVLLDQIVLVEQERDEALAALAAAREQHAALEQEVFETMVPREILSAADFPVERAMARSGETLAAFASREGTTTGVLRALNPWLTEDGVLTARQTLWVPRAPGN